MDAIVARKVKKPCYENRKQKIKKGTEEFLSLKGPNSYELSQRESNCGLPIYNPSDVAFKGFINK